MIKWRRSPCVTFLCLIFFSAVTTFSYGYAAHQDIDPLEEIFRHIVVGMSGEALVDEFSRYPSLVFYQAGDRLISQWRGKGLFSGDNNVLVTLKVRLKGGLVQCIAYHLYYDGYDDLHRHRGVCLHP